MERRKFVIGMGSLAAGGAAATGTGAFTQADVSRGVTVDVDDDVGSYVSLAPADTPNGDAYARLQGENDGATAKNDDVLLIQFNGIANNIDQDEADSGDDINVSSSELGGGVNKNAVFEFDDLITVTNQGAQPISVSVDGQNGTGGNPAKIEGLSAGADPSPTLNEADNFGGPVVEVAPASGNTIAPGESVNLHFAIATNDDSNSNYSGRVIIGGEANTGGT